MTTQTDTRRSLPHQVGRKAMAGSKNTRSRIVRLLDWALGPPIEEDDVDIGNASCCAVLLIDASGSMADDDWKPSRLDGAKEAAIAYCDQIAHEDSDALISVIAYGGGAKTMCQPTPVASIGRLRKAISDITLMGCTNINAGLKAAVNAIPDVAMPCQVVLLSDGHNTEQSPLSTATSLRDKAVIECVGIGGSPSDVGERLMKKIASAYPDGNKRYRWIGSKEELVQEYKELVGRITRK